MEPLPLSVLPGNKDFLPIEDVPPDVQKRMPKEGSNLEDGLDRLRSEALEVLSRRREAAKGIDQGKDEELRQAGAYSVLCRDYARLCQLHRVPQTIQNVLWYWLWQQDEGGKERDPVEFVPRDFDPHLSTHVELQARRVSWEDNREGFGWGGDHTVYGIIRFDTSLADDEAILKAARGLKDVLHPRGRNRGKRDAPLSKLRVLESLVQFYPYIDPDCVPEGEESPPPVPQGMSKQTWTGFAEEWSTFVEKGTRGGVLVNVIRDDIRKRHGEQPSETRVRAALKELRDSGLVTKLTSSWDIVAGWRGLLDLFREDEQQI